MSRSNAGLRDWAIQRLSAVYMAFYVVLMFAYLACHPHLTYDVWKHLFTVFWAQIGTLIFLVCLLWHAWIGIWTIFTDYVKSPSLRLFLQSIVLLALLVYFFWGVQIVWGIPLVWSF